MKVIAFDQSTRVTGFSIFVDGQYFRSGVINLAKIKDTEERSREMGIAICKEISFNLPDVVIIEDVQNQSNSTVALLARLQGVVLGYCAAHNIRIEIVTTKQLEKYKTITNMTQERFGENIESESEIASIAINEIAHRICEFDDV